MKLLLEARLDYACAGILTCPVPPDTKMSYKSAQFNGVRWGATTNLEEIRRDWQRWPNANIGILTGHENGLFVVDTNPTYSAGDRVDGAAALTELIRYWGRDWPNTLKAITPSGSEHYYFLCPDDGKFVRNSTGKLAPGIDVRGEGGMVVAPPSRRKDGAYRWVTDAPIAYAPPWLLAMVSEYRRDEDDDDDGPVHHSLVTEVMKHVPCELYWHERNNIGMAIWNCTEGSQEGFKIWDEWLMRSGRYTAVESVKRWAAFRKYPPSKLGFSLLERRANRAHRGWWDKFERQAIKELYGIVP